MNLSVISGIIQRLIRQNNPDITSAKNEIRRIARLSKTETRHLVYQAIKKINQGLFPPITELELILTWQCNLGCAYCFEKDLLGFKRMPSEIAFRAIDVLFDYSADQSNLRITFFGGEPTLNISLIKKVVNYVDIKQTAADKHVDYYMTSNGTLINEPLAKYLGEHNIRVLLSIDGLQKTHDKFRTDKRNKGTFDRVIKAMQILKKYQPWIGTKMTVMPENVHCLFNDVVGLAGLGINQFIIGSATGAVWSNDALAILKENLDLVSKWYKTAGKRSEKVRISQFDEQSNRFCNFGCQAGHNSICINVNGDISPCAKILSLNGKKCLHKLGDVNYGLTHLANRRELIHCFLLRENCKKYFIDEEYLGGCFASNFEETSDLFQPSLSQQKIRKIEFDFFKSINR